MRDCDGTRTYRDLDVREVLLAGELNVLGLDVSALRDRRWTSLHVSRRPYEVDKEGERDERKWRETDLDVVHLGSNNHDRKRGRSLSAVRRVNSLAHGKASK